MPGDDKLNGEIIYQTVPHLRSRFLVALTLKQSQCCHYSSTMARSNIREENFEEKKNTQRTIVSTIIAVGYVLELFKGTSSTGKS